MRRVAALAALAAAAVLAAGASAGKPRGAKHVWATVNICDTQRHPNTIGVRVGMGATSRRDVLYVRIRIQFLPRGSSVWRDLSQGGDSGWMRLGKGAFVERQGGVRFMFQQPQAGQRFVLRGRVAYQWRHGKTAVARARRVTEAGLPRADQGDPRHFSAASCTVS